MMKDAGGSGASQDKQDASGSGTSRTEQPAGGSATSGRGAFRRAMADLKQAHSLMKYYQKSVSTPYSEEEGDWYPPRDSNLSEIMNSVITAGRSKGVGQKPYFRMEEQTPRSYAIYRRIEDEYQRKTGCIAHTSHKLTAEEYMDVLEEVAKVIKEDPCDREWMIRNSPRCSTGCSPSQFKLEQAVEVLFDKDTPHETIYGGTVKVLTIGSVFVKYSDNTGKWYKEKYLSKLLKICQDRKKERGITEVVTTRLLLGEHFWEEKKVPVPQQSHFNAEENDMDMALIKKRALEALKRGEKFARASLMRDLRGVYPAGHAMHMVLVVARIDEEFINGFS